MERVKPLCIILYFPSGFNCERYENPADFFLDTIIHQEIQLRREYSTETVATLHPAVGDEETANRAITCGEAVVKLSESYRQSEEYRELRERIDPVLQNVVEEKRKEPMARQVVKKILARDLYATSFLWQVEHYYRLVTYKASHHYAIYNLTLLYMHCVSHYCSKWYFIIVALDCDDALSQEPCQKSPRVNISGTIEF